MSDSTVIRALAVRVFLHEPRYYGRPEWPPSPARLFQALVSGSARSRGLMRGALETFRWLENLEPPLICAPPSELGQGVRYWVPNNDLDAKDGDPANVPDIRAGKHVEPRLLRPGIPFLYVWLLPPEDESITQATRVCAIAEGLYQFGRGVDMAWAVGALLDQAALDQELYAYAGTILRPTPQGIGGRELACPHPGSVDRLEERYKAAGTRFRWEGKGRKALQVFVQPPMPSFSRVRYDGDVDRRLFELQSREEVGKKAAWSLERIHDLTVEIRDGVLARLVEFLPDQKDAIDAALVGRRPGEEATVRADQRVRIIPLPSIGSVHADRCIRRVLIELPRAGMLRADDVIWGVSGLTLNAGAEVGFVVADDDQMLRNYGSERAATLWQSITPVVLPERARRRRIEPSMRREEAKGAKERIDEETRAKRAVHEALRHAGVRTPVVSIHVQREPFGRHEPRAEQFAAGTRFPKERLWHVELEFARPLTGPLVIGDGRFLGLGLLGPQRQSLCALAFSISSGLTEEATAEGVSRAFRRAVMARFQRFLGPRRELPTFISGHSNVGPAKSVPHAHFVFDPRGNRLLAFLRGSEEGGRVDWRMEQLQEALRGLSELRAGRSGRLVLRPCTLEIDTDPLFGAARDWSSLTPYTVNRHQDVGDARAAVEADIRTSCRNEGLPAPVEVAVGPVAAPSGMGLTAHVTLSFATATKGPVLLGRTRYKGGGLFGHAQMSEPKFVAALSAFREND